MFRLPPDVELELTRKYPHVDIINLVHDLITLISQKACFDGSCPIREFGKFIAFQVYSSRLNKNTIRFKFKHSESFMKRIRNDKYILENLAVKLPTPFTDDNEQKCVDKRDRKVVLNKILPNITKITEAKTNYKVATQEILNILQNDNSNNDDDD